MDSSLFFFLNLPVQWSYLLRGNNLTCVHLVLQLSSLMCAPSIMPLFYINNVLVIAEIWGSILILHGCKHIVHSHFPYILDYLFCF